MSLDYLPNLRTIRQSQGLTRRQLAEQVGCSVNTIQRAEKALPPKSQFGLGLWVAVKIADALGVSVDHLLGRDVKVRSLIESRDHIINTLRTFEGGLR